MQQIPLCRLSLCCIISATADEDAGGKSLTVFLTKENGMEWWSRVADNEPEIDVTKVRAIVCWD